MADEIVQVSPPTLPHPHPHPQRIDIARAFAEPPRPLDFVLPGMLAGTTPGALSPAEGVVTLSPPLKGEETVGDSQTVSPTVARRQVGDMRL
jgi:hypothetical protein